MDPNELVTCIICKRRMARRGYHKHMLDFHDIDSTPRSRPQENFDDPEVIDFRCPYCQGKVYDAFSSLKRHFQTDHVAEYHQIDDVIKSSPGKRPRLASQPTSSTQSKSTDIDNSNQIFNWMSNAMNSVPGGANRSSATVTTPRNIDSNQFVNWLSTNMINANRSTGDAGSTHVGATAATTTNFDSNQFMNWLSTNVFNGNRSTGGAGSTQIGSTRSDATTIPTSQTNNPALQVFLFAILNEMVKQFEDQNKN